MNDDSHIVRVFTGSEVTVILLKGQLEEKGISSLIKNDLGSSITAGFVGGTPTSVDLYIQEKDLAMAEPIIQEFRREDGEK